MLVRGGRLPVTLITGSASGIGRHLTGVLAREGHRVLATDVSPGALQAAAEDEAWPQDSVETHLLDVREPEDWEAALDAAEERFGPVGLVMNVAGVLKPAWAMDIDPDDIDFHLAVNVKGVVLGTRAAARRMVPRGSGHIVNFGSLASLAPVPGLSLYSTSKFAVRGFSLAAAIELRDQGVAVSLVLPDAVQTPMLDLQVHYEEAALTFSGGRALTVADIGRAVVEEVLPKRPLELTLPAARGIMARAAGNFPAAAAMTRPLLVRVGRQTQARSKSKTGR
ncbi:MAG: SDR family oxidoreductase [Myxococcota bacterium]